MSRVPRVSAGQFVSVSPDPFSSGEQMKWPPGLKIKGAKRLLDGKREPLGPRGPSAAFLVPLLTASHT